MILYKDLAKVEQLWRRADSLINSQQNGQAALLIRATRIQQAKVAEYQEL